MLQRFARLFLITLLFSYNLRGQVLPAEGSKLNYRIIGFSGPSVKNGRLEIARGIFNDEASFKKNITATKEVKTGRVVAEVPSFGCDYTWRIAGKDGEAGSGLHHFSTMTAATVDTGSNRLRILQRAKAYKDAYVFVDGTRALYDMNGQPVWFLPNMWHYPNDNFEVRDLKLTYRNTITFVVGDSAFEMNYGGKILWRGPNNGRVSGNSSEMYHHQVSLLANGHYMVMGTQYIVPDTLPGSTSKTGIRIPFGTVIEYDSRGNPVWSWKSWNYFRKSDVMNKKNASGALDILTHENAFCFDEQKKMLYVNFRNISRILKIKYPEGKVLASYGEEYQPGVAEKNNDLYCHQHSLKLTGDGCLFLFNNNTRSKEAVPTLLKMREHDGHLEKVWEYTCDLGDIARTPMDFVSGGSVAELPDHSILASLSAPHCTQVFIITQDKKLLWSATPERKNPKKNEWIPLLLYSCSIIKDEREMERFVWSEP